jgi:hypothetical protein
MIARGAKEISDNGWSLSRVKQSLYGWRRIQGARNLRFDSVLPIEVYLLQLCVGGVSG